ncbi:MAG: hypothetical protein FJ318_09090 [SAR202 cluster bacterium]|nr:hypothetical protein [SAR202 cluster bacterium]
MPMSHDATAHAVSGVSAHGQMLAADAGATNNAAPTASSNSACAANSNRAHAGIGDACGGSPPGARNCIASSASMRGGTPA